MDLTRPELHPMFFFVLLESKDPEWEQLGPQQLWELVARAGQVSRPNKNKIQAVKTLCMTEAPFDDWRLFSNVVWALNGDTPDFGLVDPPSIPALTVGARAMREVRAGFEKVRDQTLTMAGAVSAVPPFSPDVLRFAASCAAFHGCSRLGRPLEEATGLIPASGGDEHQFRLAEQAGAAMDSCWEAQKHELEALV